jgi:cephalosporin hydroxylase
MVLTAQIDWELKELIRIYEELAPLHVLEIGTQMGGTLWYWLESAIDEAVVVNIDILQNMTDRDKQRLPGLWHDWARPMVEQHTLIGRSDDPEIMQQALAYLNDNIDFLFIDAVHTYEGAKSDFELYGPWVNPGGIIALHDLMTPDFSPHIQVGKLWREIQEAGYQTKELRAGGIYGGIGVVYV